MEWVSEVKKKSDIYFYLRLFVRQDFTREIYIIINFNISKWNEQNEFKILLSNIEKNIKNFINLINIKYFIFTI